MVFDDASFSVVSSSRTCALLVFDDASRSVHSISRYVIAFDDASLRV